MTERAYDNPKFVEDLVRDIARALVADPRVQAFVVESENFESSTTTRLRPHPPPPLTAHAPAVAKADLPAKSPGLPTPVQLAAQMGKKTTAGGSIAASAAGRQGRLNPLTKSLLALWRGPRMAARAQSADAQRWVVEQCLALPPSAQNLSCAVSPPPRPGFRLPPPAGHSHEQFPAIQSWARQ